MSMITLYYREGSSDKVYQVELVKAKAGYAVNFAYGRRGQTMNTGTKTQEPVSLAKAQAIYDKLVAEKKAKGYTEGETGTPFQDLAGEQKHTGIACQLLNPIEEDELEKYVKDPNFCMQEKFDGRRMLVNCEPLGSNGQDIKGINRRGLVVALPITLEGAAMELQADQFIVDGEAVGEALYAFDLLEFNGLDLRPASYESRLADLYRLLGEDTGSPIRMVESAQDIANKRALLKRLRKEGAEGVVIKELDAPYTPGRPASGGPQLKFKFCQTASCIVIGHNDKRSVSLGLIDATQLDAAVTSCGRAAIPPNHQVPSIGELVEVRYLYAMPGSNALYQPVYLGPREDIDREDCVLKQLKYKTKEE